MSNELNVHLPMIADSIGIKCILVNPRKCIKEYEWHDGDMEELVINIGWGALDCCNLRKKDIRNYTTLYFDTPLMSKQPPSIYVKGDPICFGPCAIFNKGIESLEKDDVNYLMDKKYLYTYDGKTGVCIRLE